MRCANESWLVLKYIDRTGQAQKKVFGLWAFFVYMGFHDGGSSLK